MANQDEDRKPLWRLSELWQEGCFEFTRRELLLELNQLVIQISKSLWDLIWDSGIVIHSCFDFLKVAHHPSLLLLFTFYMLVWRHDGSSRESSNKQANWCARTAY